MIAGAHIVIHSTSPRSQNCGWLMWTAILRLELTNLVKRLITITAGGLIQRGWLHPLVRQSPGVMPEDRHALPQSDG